MCVLHTYIHVNRRRFTIEYFLNLSLYIYVHIYIYIYIGPSAKWFKCASMFRETGHFDQQVDSYQRLKKWYLIPRLTLSIIRYRSRESVASSLPYISVWWLLKKEPSVGQPIFKYECRQKTLLAENDDVISAVDDFFDHGIQVLQHSRKKYLDLKRRLC